MFHAQTIAHEFATAVCLIAAVLKLRDHHLADQLKRAATSAVLNLAEGNHRAGRDRVARFRIASGECAEARAALRLAIDAGHVAADAVGDALALGDRLGAMLWRLTHPRR